MHNLRSCFIYQIEKSFNMFILSRNQEEQDEFFKEMENLKTEDEQIAFYKSFMIFQTFYKYIRECFNLLHSDSDKINLLNEIKNFLMKKYGNYCEIQNDIIISENIVVILNKLIEFLDYIYEEIDQSLISEKDLNEFNNSFNINDIYNFINKGEDLNG